MARLSDLGRTEWPRTEIRRGLLDAGVPADKVDEISDLAIQAAEQASAAAFRTLDAASSLQIQICAFGVAFCLVSNFAERMIAAQADLGELIGAPTRTMEISKNG